MARKRHVQRATEGVGEAPIYSTAAAQVMGTTNVMTRNKEEARRLAVDALDPLRSVSYEELLAESLKRSDTVQVEGRDGVEYNLEVTALLGRPQEANLASPRVRR